jgi:7-keto-8-aminopelargonate synthetase-like enzyme
MLDPLVARDVPADALTGSLRDFRNPSGQDLLARVQPFYGWQDRRRAHGVWPYAKATDGAPLPVCTAHDDAGRSIHGVNFASQDYLGLASHPAIKAAAKATIDEYGVHSAGSPALAGNTRYSRQLEACLGEFLGMDEVVLYPTGWAAGFGAIRALVRDDDHVVLDGLAHACLQEGASAATRNVHLHAHLSLGSLRRILARIRQRDAANGILVVTESLFSMDSDTPNLEAMQSLCREFGALLMVDVAHDLGCLGPAGGGHVAAQGLRGRLDLMMGSFSKTFASNGGFVASRSAAVREYLKYYGSSATFSNALSPVQCATILKAFEIVRSPEGQVRRDLLLDRILHLRQRLQGAGFTVLGDPSPIAPVLVGPEDRARLIVRQVQQRGALVNLVEYPAVAKGRARLRLQVMASHSRRHADELVERLREATAACDLAGHSGAAAVREVELAAD